MRSHRPANMNTSYFFAVLLDYTPGSADFHSHPGLRWHENLANADAHLGVSL